MLIWLKKINPLILLIVVSILLFILREFLFPEYSDIALSRIMEELLSTFGMMSIVYLLFIYFFCSFFYIPILIPLNIACGALYGPVLGSFVSLAGVLVSCIASTISVRYVFRGMGKFAMRHQDVKKFLNQFTRYGTIVVLIVRLAFVVPYLLQNIILAMTNIKLDRLLLLTLFGAMPGVISYSFLGAGMVSLDDAGTYGIYLLVPLALLVAVSVFIHVTRKQMGIGRSED
ncbi:MAG: putative membrane protein YdjX (TVP38/TMEM64 family) [Pseudohongiellaceae bacterium]|jgi:uncharacterized membrane protein YdjX (TVP38/TMEM64 family)